MSVYQSEIDRAQTEKLALRAILYHRLTPGSPEPVLEPSFVTYIVLSAEELREELKIINKKISALYAKSRDEKLSSSNGK